MTARALQLTRPGFAIEHDQMTPPPVRRRPSSIDQLAERYELMERIGEGGMGVVFRARHRALDREFAIKVLRAEYTRRPDVLERLRREALSASRARSPHVVKVADFGRLPDGSAYLAMELLRGRELADELDRHGAFSWRRAAAITRQICEALAEVHEEGIVHRDLKPENVFLIEREDDVDFVKIVDFGLAKIGGVASITLAGMAIGTPHYMSPEQCLGETTDHRTDIYSLGVILYEMLAGRVPFQEVSFPGILAAQVGRAPDPIAEHAPGLTDAEAAVVMRCLEKDRRDRFQSARELLTALDAVARGEHPASTPTQSGARRVVRQREVATYRPPRPLTIQRSQLPLLLALALGPLVPFAIVLGVLSQREVPPTALTTVEVAALPPAVTTSILVTSDPSGADVAVEGRALGRTPLAVPVGGDEALRVSLSRAGYATREVRLSSAASRSVRFYLDPVGHPEEARFTGGTGTPR